MNKKKHRLKYIISDFIAACLSWLAFNWIRKTIVESNVYGINIKLEFHWYLLVSTICVGLFWLLIYYFIGYYNNIYKKSRLQEFNQTLISSIVGVVFLFFTLLLDDVVVNYKSYYISSSGLLFFHFIFTYIPRNIITSITIGKLRDGKIGFNTLIVGSNDEALHVVQSFSAKQHKNIGYRFVGFVNIYDKSAPELEKKCKNLGNFKDINKIISENNVEEVIIAIELNEYSEISKIVCELQKYNITIKTITNLYQILIGKTELSLIGGLPLLHINANFMPLWEQHFKLFFDKIAAIFFIVLFSPLYIITAILVKLTSKGNIIYKQKRVGLDEKDFYIYKFRSMVKDAESNGPELSSINDTRITRFGYFMRKTRLDETPQFFNVLKGDMSIVGPRPERRYYINKILKHAPEYQMLLKIKPGITSLGQVKFGYAENVSQMLERLKFDIIYINNMSLYLDFKILIFTVSTILKGNGK